VKALRLFLTLTICTILGGVCGWLLACAFGVNPWGFMGGALIGLVGWFVLSAVKLMAEYVYGSTED
jgi:F0F1-type ATP synthase assembly protein I